MRPIVEERERVAEALRGIGLEPWPSQANFLYVPFEDAEQTAEELMRQGIAVRRLPAAMRITIRNRQDDDRLLGALAGAR